MTIISTTTTALDYIRNVLIVPDYYDNGSLYIALYNPENNELYTDLTTYIMPVLPCQIYIENGSEKERFAKEQRHLFIPLDVTVKSGFNTYSLYVYNGFIH